MILPFLRGILSFKKAPVTWALFFINLCVMIATSEVATISQKPLNQLLEDEYFVSVQGRLFAQFIKDHPNDYSGVMEDLSALAVDGDSERVRLLGGLAMRNAKFMAEAPGYQFSGDQVAVNYWKHKIEKVARVRQVHPSFILGLSADDVGLEKWLSYIFVHSGMPHFLMNMGFLLIFGSILEPVIGGLALLVTFLMSGMLAAGAFLVLTGASWAPLVGASGAVSGLMALFCFYYWKTPVRYVYWLFLPLRGFFGYVYLPGWVTLIMWGASDLAGYLSSLNELGGVAYTAHLGGEMSGLLVGAIVYMLRFRKQKPVPSAGEKLGAVYPFPAYGLVFRSIQTNGPTNWFVRDRRQSPR